MAMTSRAAGACALAILLVALDIGAAQARPSTLQYTCAGAKDFIKKQGAVTMSTGANTFTRFVAPGTRCLAQQGIGTVYAPTKDVKRCALTTCRRRRSSDGSR